MTSQNSQCELYFHAEANSRRQNGKFNFLSANNVSIYHG